MGSQNSQPIRKRKKRRKGRFHPERLLFVIIVFSLILYALISLLISCLHNDEEASSGAEPNQQITTTPPENSATPATTTVTTESLTEPIQLTKFSCGVNNILSFTEDIDERAYDSITVDSEDVHKGLLILVNNEYQYVFPETYDPPLLIEHKNDSYTVKDYTVYIDSVVIDPLNRLLSDYTAAFEKNIMVISGYRTKEYQQHLYDSDLNATGLSYSALVAKPGHSEHHIGLAVDFSIRNESGVSRSYDGTGTEKWINENCHEYGFILRYPDGYSNKTGIQYEPWHFRYLGLPHSIATVASGGCYEDYIEYLKEFEFGKRHLGIYSAGDVYEVYYMPASEETTTLKVPTERSYTISGNNVDGFIITVEVTPSSQD